MSRITQLGPPIPLPIGVTGMLNGGDPYLIEPCTGGTILGQFTPGTQTPGVGQLTSNATAALALRFNRPDAPWLTFSLAGFVNRASGEFYRSWRGWVDRFWAYCLVADVVEGNPNIFIMPLRQFELESTRVWVPTAGAQVISLHGSGI